jgi:ABC-2 type transport system permease protein
LRLAKAFFIRDMRINLSYRVAFFAQFAGNLLVIGLFYFIGKMVGTQPLPALASYGGSLLAYLLIGIALTDCVGVSLFSFAQQIREGQTTGTLEAALMSPVGLGKILIYSSLWNYFLSAVRFVLYLTAGSLLYGADLSRCNLPAAMLVFVLTVLCFMGIGILWAGALLMIKRGESIVTFGATLVLLTGGVLFPVSMLPGWVQWLGNAIPLTHALDGMRHALLQGYSIRQLSPVLLRLAAFAVALVSIGIGGFSWAVDQAKHSGSLTQY